MKKLVKMLALALCLGVGTFALASCADPASQADGNDITVAIARPTSSGTRGAFDELVVNSEGEALEEVAQLASCVQESGETGTVITAVTGNKKALGYISLGSVAGNDGIKAIQVNGVDPTVANIKSGEYELSRPFNLVYQGDILQTNELAADFVKFIESTQGQTIVNSEWIGQVDDAEEYVANSYTGSTTSLTLWGSTSVNPLMTQLVSKYQELNSNKTFNFTVGGDGSGAGESEAQKGNGAIGMISRECKVEGLNVYKLADDGIAIIVNSACPLTNVTIDQLYDLYANGTFIAVPGGDEESAS